MKLDSGRTQRGPSDGLSAARAEDEVASQQTGLHSSVATTDEVETDVGEVGEQLPNGVGREHAQVGGVVLRRTPAQETKAALDTERVRNRAGEHASGTEYALNLHDESIREPEVLQELACDDGVEARVVERQRLLDVRLHGLDPERRSLPERGRVDVEPDHGVPVEEVPRQRPRPAAEIEDALSAADRGDE
jgi:hypothetical protein